MDFRVSLHVEAGGHRTPEIKLLPRIISALSSHRGHLSVSHGAARLDAVDIISHTVGVSTQINALWYLGKNVLLDFLFSDESW